MLKLTTNYEAPPPKGFGPTFSFAVVVGRIGRARGDIWPSNLRAGGNTTNKLNTKGVVN